MDSPSTGVRRGKLFLSASEPLSRSTEFSLLSNYSVTYSVVISLVYVYGAVYVSEVGGHVWEPVLLPPHTTEPSPSPSPSFPDLQSWS